MENLKFKMLNKITIVILFILILLQAGSAIATTSTSSCAKILDIYKRRDCYANEAAAANKAAEQKKKEAEQVKQQISVVEDNIDQTTSAITQTQTEISEAEAAIAGLEIKIKTEEENLAKEQDRMGNLLASWYMDGEEGLLEILLTSNNISNVITKEQYYESIRQQIDTSMEKIKVLRASLKQQKDDQDKRIIVLSDTQESQLQQKTYLENQENYKQRLLTNATQAIADFKKEEAQALDKYRAAQGEIRSIEQAAQRGSSWVPSGSSASGFMWPMQGSLAYPFGYSPGYFGGQVFHTGVDMRAYADAPVYASKAGTVVSTRDGMGNTYAWNLSYGNYVKIQHEGGVYTLYGHLINGSVAVSVGDTVSQGQMIGRMGNTGYSTGPHLHFEIRDPYNIPINPVQFLP